MKTLLSWNVNGIRACINKGFLDTLQHLDPDIICLQETKAEPEQVDADFPETYHQFWNPAKKKGYSGTAIFSKIEPHHVHYGIGVEEHDQEGRVITAEFDHFHLVTVYTPNAQNQLRRLDYRLRWNADFLSYIQQLEQTKPVVFCGDLNVAHQEIDIARPKANRRNAGFTDEERAGFDDILAAGYLDTFRQFSTEPEQYSWWSYRAGARERNVGWRLDYFCLSEHLRPRLNNAFILQQITGSDHCPVGIELDCS